MKTKQERKNEAYEKYEEIVEPALKKYKEIQQPAYKKYLEECKKIDEEEDPKEIIQNGKTYRLVEE